VHRDEVPKTEEIRDLRRADQADQIKIQMRPARRRDVIVVVQLRVGPVEIILPHAASHDRRLKRTLKRKSGGSVQSSRPMSWPKRDSFVAGLRRNEGRPAMPHFMRNL